MPLPQILVPEQISEYKKVLKEEKSKQNAIIQKKNPQFGLFGSSQAFHHFL
jgi:hypothetical protein